MTLHDGFKDYFSGESESYARHRPGYPPALFKYLASLTDPHDLAWDVGTGSGQAAVGMAAHFRLVIASDASEAQLAAAIPHPRVSYRRALAHESGLSDRSASLVTVAQALHWFDRESFFGEVDRVLLQGGILAVWGYGDLTMEPALGEIVTRFSKETVGGWWTEDRRIVDEGYSSIILPFHELEPPPFTLSASWTLPELVGYLATWSAVRRYRSDQKVDPIPQAARELAARWGVPDRQYEIRWPLFLRVGRKP